MWAPLSCNLILADKLYSGYSHLKNKHRKSQMAENDINYTLPQLELKRTVKSSIYVNSNYCIRLLKGPVTVSYCVPKGFIKHKSVS